MSESDGTGTRSDDAPPDTSADQNAPRWKVFVSSTSFGLRGIRQVAREVIDNFRFDGVKCFEPVVMERFGAQAATPREVCANEVRACDLLVGILGIRYGAHPPDDETSYTELELDTAEQERIPPLMFLLNEEMAAGLEADRPQEEGQADRQNQFRDRALDSLVVEPDVISEEDFRKKLHDALDKWVRDYSFTRELVNHSAEFQRTRKRLLSLSERTGGAALIFGEPGTGKTAMFNALLNDTLLMRTFPHLFSATIRLAEGADEVEQQRARLQSALEELPPAASRRPCTAGADRGAIGARCRVGPEGGSGHAEQAEEAVHLGRTAGGGPGRDQQPRGPAAAGTRPGVATRRGDDSG